MPELVLSQFRGIVTSPTADSLAEGMAADGHDFLPGDAGPDSGIPLAPGMGRTRAISSRLSPVGAPENKFAVYALAPEPGLHVSDGKMIAVVQHGASGAAAVVGLDYYDALGAARSIRQGTSYLPPPRSESSESSEDNAGAGSETSELTAKPNTDGTRVGQISPTSSSDISAIGGYWRWTGLDWVWQSGQPAA